MKLKTEINEPKADFQINYGQRILCLGSCFAENMGIRLKRAKMDCITNPFGILFNPISIEQALQRIITGTSYTEAELIQGNGYWHSFDHHGKFSSHSPKETLQKMNTSLANAHAVIQQTDLFIITLGTAFVFKHIQQDRVVANCHKFPNALFQRTRISSSDCAAVIINISTAIQTANPKAKIIFTVSPVRHIRDGIVNNSTSKSILKVAVAETLASMENACYFHSYELMMDELRDYRFYKEDMLHPSPLAENIIWNKFIQHFMSPETINLLERIQRIEKTMEHEIIHTDQLSLEKLKAAEIEKIKRFQEEHPNIDMNSALEHWRNL